MIHRLLAFFTPTAVLLMCVSCDSHKTDREATRQSDAALKSSTAAENPEVATPGEIQKFTGGRTRLVWCENQSAELDLFGDGNELVLKGLDTGDQKGERVLGKKVGNYARPLLSSDGGTILFTDKHGAMRGDVKSFSPVVFRTDWAGSEPVKVADGYAVDCWHDPATGKEWVYALRDIYPTRQGLPMAGQRLVRFRLDDPSIVESLYDDTALSPDNIQLSRDGTAASGLFPWPNAGVLRQVNGKWEAHKLANGCCTAMAPDNSGVSWVFDGTHRAANFFADDGAKSWSVSFGEAPGVGSGELYHPRWTNHARFILVTGPYHFMRVDEKKMVNGVPVETIAFGSDLTQRPQVCLGKLGKSAGKVVAWLQITSGAKDKYYPDAWIEGGALSALEGFTMAAPAGVSPATAQTTWPVNPEGLAFLWRDRKAMNIFQAPDGKHVESKLRGVGPARFGRLSEMIFDGGHFEMEGKAAPAALQGLSGNEASLEALVLPSADPSVLQDAPDPIFRSPLWVMAQGKDGTLLLSHANDVWQTAAPLPKTPFHLAVAMHVQNFDVYVNGIAVAQIPAAPRRELMGGDKVELGGGHHSGLLDVAIFNRPLTKTEVMQDAMLQAQRLASLPAPPERVRVLATLEEVSPVPTVEAIAPYPNCLAVDGYKIQKVLQGHVTGGRILVKHWVLLGRAAAGGVSRTVGNNYELELERAVDHPELEGERVSDTTTAFDLEPWFDVSVPVVGS